ncbi:MAG TPA: DUF3276 family protein [Saprospiraceae bacterium]|nr:DUF3276 family protein [Saprospiraceae bacterium]
MNQNESSPENVHSLKLVAGNRRTYYFDIKKGKGEDNFYLVITESIKRNDGRGFDKHKIMLFKEDLNRFGEMVNTSLDHIKSQLLPDYDFEHYSKKQKEWEDEQSIIDSQNLE